MTIEQKRRELFEVSVEHRFPFADRFRTDKKGNYFYNAVHSAWGIWNAALDAVVIELPQSWNLSESEYRESCIDAIESTGLGLKVLP